MGQVTRRSQIASALRRIHDLLTGLYKEVGDEVAAGREEAARAALQKQVDFDRSLLRAYRSREFVDVLDSLEARVDRNIAVALNRFDRSAVPLSRQVYKTAALANGWVDRAIDSALARGATPRELAKDVYDFIHPGTRGGASYAALRLGRTELNNAYHAAQIYDMNSKPWVVAAQWHLSGSHPKKDICDVMAAQDLHGLGPGRYRTADVPGKAHPQCLCFITPEMPSAARLDALIAAGAFDDYR